MSTLTPRRARTDRRFDSLEQEAVLGLWRTYNRLRALEDELFGRHGLAPQQYNEGDGDSSKSRASSPSPASV